MTPITPAQLFLLRTSSASAQHLLRQLNIRGWPRVSYNPHTNSHSLIHS